jgi:hypothetical protein
MAIFEGFSAEKRDSLDASGRPQIQFDIQVQNVE